MDGHHLVFLYRSMILAHESFDGGVDHVHHHRFFGSLSDGAGDRSEDRIGIGLRLSGQGNPGPGRRQVRDRRVQVRKGLEESPTVWTFPAKQWNRIMAYIQEAVLGELLKDNVVCQGLAARLYVLGVSHALRVRILTDPQTHIQAVAKKEGFPRPGRKRSSIAGKNSAGAGP